MSPDQNARRYQKAQNRHLPDAYSDRGSVQYSCEVDPGLACSVQSRNGVEQIEGAGMVANAPPDPPEHLD